MIKILLNLKSALLITIPTKYVQLFNDCLKQKHHFLTYYCNIIKLSGPLKYLLTYNFESKHRELKSYSKKY
jgi:hypothetical protein